MKAVFPFRQIRFTNVLAAARRRSSSMYAVPPAFDADDRIIVVFNREHQGLAITEAGRDYLAVVRDAFDRLTLGTDRLLQRQRSGAITVSTSPDFAAKWLVRWLGRFAAVHPEINLKVSATMHRVDFAREEVDLAIRHGTGDWPGLHAVNLCSEELFPVCNPALLRSRRGIH